MKGGAQAALAIGVGYILGRRRKMRLATMLAVGAATGGIGGLAPAALRRGAKYLGTTDIAGALGPQVGDIVNTVRGELLDAAKGAAAAAVTSRIDSLSDSLHERAETLRNPEAAVGRVGETAGETMGRAGETVGRAGETVGRAGETVGRAGETVGRAGGSLGRLRRRGRPIEEKADDFDQEEQEEEERRNGRAGRQRPHAGKSARPEADEAEEPDEDHREPEDEYEDEPVEDELDEASARKSDELDEEPEEAPPPRRRTARSPVTRAGR
jgi:hypothetical protein